jgi:hypothetical protein
VDCQLLAKQPINQLFTPIPTICPTDLRLQTGERLIQVVGLDFTQYLPVNAAICIENNGKWQASTGISELAKRIDGPSANDP